MLLEKVLLSHDFHSKTLTVLADDGGEPKSTEREAGESLHYGRFLSVSGTNKGAEKLSLVIVSIFVLYRV